MLGNIYTEKINAELYSNVKLESYKLFMARMKQR